jgi:hypothetical protein
MGMGLRRLLLLPPLLLLLLVLGLIAFSGQRVLHIRAENQLLREYSLAVADAEAAQAALQRLDELVTAMLHPGTRDLDELHFQYLDVYREFTQRLQSPRLQSRLTEDARATLQHLPAALAYSDQLDPGVMSLAIARGRPLLDAARRGLWAHKRDAYEHYYESVQRNTGQLSRVFVAALAICLLLGVPLVVWASRRVERQMRGLALRVWISRCRASSAACSRVVAAVSCCARWTKSAGASPSTCMTRCCPASPT